MSDLLYQRVRKLGLYGLAANWAELGHETWVSQLVEVEEAERQSRSLQRRLRSSRIGDFKLMADFDWAWPATIDRELIEDLFTLQFLDEGANVVLIGNRGLGKTMIAQNLVHEALLRGHTALFTTTSAMLNDLAAQDGPLALKRRLHRYCTPQLLVCDEVGYLSYDRRHADLLFEVVSQRYKTRSTVITTNKHFPEWGEVFPNAGCVASLIDRVIHKAEITYVDGESFRLKESKERAAQRSVARRKRKGGKSAPHDD